MEAAGASAATSMTRPLATAWLADVETLTARLMAAIFTDNPEWTDYRPVPRADLQDGCRRYLARVLELLGGARDMDESDDVAEQIGRQRADQGVPLEAMLRTFRLGGRIVWEALLERAAAAQVEPRAVGAAATAMWTVVDGLSSALSTSYRRAQSEQLRRDDQHRHALMEEVLAGHATDGGFGQRIADQLQLTIGGSYLVAVAEVDAGGSAALHNPQTALAALGVRSLWHARVDSLVGLVPLEGHDPRFVLDRLRGVVRGRAAVATTSRGLADVGVAHRLAAVALGTMPTGVTELVRIEDRYEQSLLLMSPALRSRLVHDWLGPVLALPTKDAALLLETLTRWLEADRSAGVAAERLYCHRNTVLNRLHRITTLVGRDLTGRQAFVELSLALSALDLPADTPSP
ncbi:PucR family transcriptional regulator [Pseudonocardia sp. GCM10023141]|uniref:PucR family transcriptional regulator n=1 Tax=Pseudonocardia sp. GCM10023141 TaxID=3252653 RepID=UPI003615D549